MDRYTNLREDISQILENCGRVISRLEDYERLPVPSKQMGLDLEISSMEIFMQNLANELRKRLL
jgi:hypothetical protein